MKRVVRSGSVILTGSDGVQVSVTRTGEFAELVATDATGDLLMVIRTKSRPSKITKDRALSGAVETLMDSALSDSGWEKEIAK